MGWIVSFGTVMDCSFLAIDDEIDTCFFFFAAFLSYASKIFFLATIFPFFCFGAFLVCLALE